MIMECPECLDFYANHPEYIFHTCDTCYAQIMNDSSVLVSVKDLFPDWVESSTDPKTKELIKE